MKQFCPVRFILESDLNSYLGIAFLFAFLITLKPVESIGQMTSSIVALQKTQPHNRITGSIEIDYNLVQNDDDFLMPTIVLEVSGWHFEGRHNYEERNSSSLWIGYNLETGKDLHLKVTPLAGLVIGSVAGAAPGLEFELKYGILSLIAQSEYFFNAENNEDSYFYSWNEIEIAPLDWLYAGIVVERTKAFETDTDVQTGLFGGIAYSNFYFTTYFFDPDKHDRNVLFALGCEF